MSQTDSATARSPASAEPALADADTAALAKGGRTNFLGFIMRLVARLPFLYFAGRWYGPEAVGRFAFAVLVIELVAQLATLGLKRGLAEQLSAEGADHRHVVWDGMFVAFLASAIGSAILLLLPHIMFPAGDIDSTDRWMALLVFAIAGTDVALAACAYRFDIGATVRARAVVEPWVISIAAAGFWYVSPRDGLMLSYAAAMVGAFLTALIPMIRHYGGPGVWRPQPSHLIMVARRNAPLAAADAIEWGTRRLDLFILGQFTSPTIYGIYYMAQQVASLPQKLKTSFEPILGPVITRNLAENRLGAIAAQVSQVGFWIIAAQAGIALALGIPGEAVMGLVGPQFVGGAGALAFLLAAEVVAATAVVSEAALVYVARHRNLLISLATLALQAVLSVVLILIARSMGLDPITYAAAVALALMLALGFASVVKARLLAKVLGAPVNSLRWALVWATGGAAVLGWGATKLPEWAELLIGVPVILGIYAWLIWTRGFGPADRALFRKHPEAAEPAA
ncbi:lipopolysaccharide biosynthesis protein [Sphingopyxis lindanitolerans]|uniref:lipopolysaccharide biosynthesis protein n=1 Tax=Sphingopyxis lindanitolerans TaxID=2054227 RepID=UPI0018652C98|nr:lipopolysaccharide biosynthesis protein [Sphingopyxis lindanitolerans]